MNKSLKIIRNCIS